MEKKLAAAQMSRVEMRDPYKTYNKFSISDFSKKTPGMDWSSILVKLKAEGQDSILVNSPRFFSVADSINKCTHCGLANLSAVEHLEVFGAVSEQIFSGCKLCL